MKKYFKFILFIIALCSLLAPFTVISATAAEVTAKTLHYVYDDANVFTEEQKNTLQELCQTKGAEAGVDIILLTNYFTSSAEEKIYMENFYDEYYEAGLLKADTTILLLNMELRNIYIQGYGKCEFYISNDRIEHILDDIIIFHLADDRYYEGMTLFIDEVVYYMGQDAGVSFEYEDGQDYGETYNGLTEYYHVSLTPAQALGSVPFGLIALIACAIGGISLAVMASSSGGKVTINNRSYLDNAHSGLTASRDDYVRTTVTKRRKPQENNTSSGPRSSGGGGRSSGGHSHSGGSRGF